MVKWEPQLWRSFVQLWFELLLISAGHTKDVLGRPSLDCVCVNFSIASGQSCYPFILFASKYFSPIINIFQTKSNFIMKPVMDSFQFEEICISTLLRTRSSVVFKSSSPKQRTPRILQKSSESFKLSLAVSEEEGKYILSISATKLIFQCLNDSTGIAWGIW